MKGLFRFRHLKTNNLRIRSKLVFFEKTYTQKLSATTLFWSPITALGFKKPQQLLQFAY